MRYGGFWLKYRLNDAWALVGRVFPVVDAADLCGIYVISYGWKLFWRPIGVDQYKLYFFLASLMELAFWVSIRRFITKGRKSSRAISLGRPHW